MYKNSQTARNHFIYFQGPWIPPKIDNPEYVPDKKLYMHDDIGAIGLEIWQVQSGTIFDNILVTDSIKVAKVIIL